MFIVGIRNTAVFKLKPLLWTHVYSYMFSTVHPPRLLVRGGGGTHSMSGLNLPLQWHLRAPHVHGNSHVDIMFSYKFMHL